MDEWFHNLLAAKHCAGLETGRVYNYTALIHCKGLLLDVNDEAVVSEEVTQDYLPPACPSLHHPTQQVM